MKAISLQKRHLQPASTFLKSFLMEKLKKSWLALLQKKIRMSKLKQAQT